jgi:hypothetical protein
MMMASKFSIATPEMPGKKKKLQVGHEQKTAADRNRILDEG